MSPVADPYLEDLRAWRRRLCEHLGLNPEQVFRLDDLPDYTVGWRATDPQDPAVGLATPVRAERTGDDPVFYRGEVLFRPDEWEEVIAAIGPKPELLTREEKLILKGLAAEAADRGQSGPGI